MKSTLILFTKAAYICRVKTRLWPKLSHRECLYLHRKLIKHILDKNYQKHFEVKIYTTSDHKNDFANYRTHKQIGFDLGTRMLNAISQELKHTSRAVLIGSDCVEFSNKYIETAFQALEKQNDVVVGPTNDGGYALIGMCKPYPALFKDIPWSTPNVLKSTVKKINETSTNLTLLPEVIDIDEYSDLTDLYHKGTLPSWAYSLIRQ